MTVLSSSLEDMDNDLLLEALFDRDNMGVLRLVDPLPASRLLSSDGDREQMYA